MTAENPSQILEHHLEAFFTGHRIEYETWNEGPILGVLPSFRVARIAPGPRIPLWSFVSIGAWEVGESPSGLEFLVLAAEDLPRHVEFLARTAHYHFTQRLGKWHTFPIGQPWLPGSSLNHVLVSLPYPLGPEFEVCNVPGGHIHLLWLLPRGASGRDHTPPSTISTWGSLSC